MTEPNGKRAHPPGDVFKLLLAEVIEGVIELIAHFIAHHPAEADPTGLGQTLQSGGQIYPVAVDVGVLDDDIALVDADPELDPLLRWNGSVALHHPALHLDSTSDRIDNAGKFDQQAVAGGLDDATAVLFDFRIDQLAEVGLEPSVRSLLICAH